MISEGVDAWTLWGQREISMNLQELWGKQKAGGHMHRAGPGLLDRHGPLWESSTCTKRQARTHRCPTYQDVKSIGSWSTAPHEDLRRRDLASQGCLRRSEVLSQVEGRVCRSHSGSVG